MILFPSSHPETFYRRIKALENEVILKRFIRGFYVADEFDFKTLSQKISPASYISMDTVLADELMIGTIPQNEVRAVKVGKKREYKTELVRIIHFGISSHINFGFYRRDGINIAFKEKALLDVLYFYMKGAKYYFDIYSDINTDQLDVKKLENYLHQYRNPKFIRFVQEFIHERVFSG